MAEGNGELLAEESLKAESSVERTEDYQKLIDYGLDEKVAGKLDEIYKTGKLAHVDLDERALDALKEFPPDGALNVLGQFLDSNLEHVSNKSAYLCGVMKTYRQKSRAGSSQGPSTPAPAPVKGPDEDKIKQILDRTGYTLDVTTGKGGWTVCFFFTWTWPVTFSVIHINRFLRLTTFFFYKTGRF